MFSMKLGACIIESFFINFFENISDGTVPKPKVIHIIQHDQICSIIAVAFFPLISNYIVTKEFVILIRKRLHDF